MMNSEVASDVKLFMSSLKGLVGKCSSKARVAMPGSSMVNFLNQVRMFPPNGFEFLDAVRFVVLGATPSIAAATAMAACILDAYAKSRGWPPLVRALLTPHGLVASLDSSGGMLSRRPALVAHVAELMSDAQRRTPAEIYDRAMTGVLHKLTRESQADFLTAMHHLDPIFRKALWALAMGDATLLAPLQRSDNAVTFAMSLCEPASGSSCRVLMPPYGSLVKMCLGPKGGVRVRVVGFNKMALDGDVHALLGWSSSTRNSAYSTTPTARR